MNEEGKRLYELLLAVMRVRHKATHGGPNTPQWANMDPSEQKSWDIIAHDFTRGRTAKEWIQPP